MKKNDYNNNENNENNNNYYNQSPVHRGVEIE